MKTILSSFLKTKKYARRGGKVAGDARKNIEKDTGRPVITSQDAVQLNAVVVNMIEGVAEAEKTKDDEK